MKDLTLPAPKGRGINWRDYIIYMVFVGIFVFFSVVLHDKGFLSAVNLMNIARQTASRMLSVSCRVSAATMALSATVAPNERSISAALSTKVMPTAMMAMVAV